MSDMPLSREWWIRKTAGQFGVGGFDVEEMDFPERFGEVYRGFAEIGDIVFDEFVR